MFTKIPREQIRFLSALSFSMGALILILGGWKLEVFRATGITCMAGAIWLIAMSESILLSKVQNEMHCALEEFSRKRESEIQDLLYFLISKNKIFGI